MSISTGAVAVASDVLALPVYSAASTIKVASAPALVYATTSTYTIFKSISIPGSGSFRVTFDMIVETVSGPTTYGRVYRNGAAIGTEQTETTTTWVTKSEDIAGWNSGDLCQLYAKKEGSGSNTGLRDFFLYASVDKSAFRVIQSS